MYKEEGISMNNSNIKHLNDKDNYDFFINLIKEYDSFVIVSETDLDGIITYVSQGFLDLTGYSKEELIGKNHNIVRDPSVPSIVFKNMWEKLKNDQIVYGEFSSKKKDGSVYWVKAKMMPIYDKGVKIGYRALRTDITDKKRLEILNHRLEESTMELSVSNEQLSEANNELAMHKNNLELQNYELEKNLGDHEELLQNNRLLLQTTENLAEDIKKEREKINQFKHEMITIFTHELKTPLNAIINFSDYIYRNLQKTLTPKKIAKLTDLAQKINENGLIELNMVQNILEISKTQAKKLVLNKELMNLKRVVNSVVDRYCDAYNKEVILELEDVEYYIDIQKFTMIFDNLFSNALKYSNSCVVIVLNKQKDGYILTIEDDGMGIKEDDREKIFNLFEQLDTDALTRDKSGTGVGLYTVKLLCEQTNCDIKIDKSIRLGGAKFTLCNNESQ